MSLEGLDDIIGNRFMMCYKDGNMTDERCKVLIKSLFDGVMSDIDLTNCRRGELERTLNNMLTCYYEFTESYSERISKRIESERKFLAQLKGELLTIPEELTFERGNFEWLIYQKEEEIKKLEQELASFIG